MLVLTDQLFPALRNLIQVTSLEILYFFFFETHPHMETNNYVRDIDYLLGEGAGKMTSLNLKRAREKLKNPTKTNNQPTKKNQNSLKAL